MKPLTSPKKRAVFLDRDGVITREPPHWAHKLEHLNLYREVVPAIRTFNRHNFRTVIVSNQAGVAHGYYSQKTMHIFNKALIEKLKKRGAVIDAIYTCVHHPEAKRALHRKSCVCRKPAPGMLLEAAEKFNIDLDTSFMIGDKLSDIEAGKRAGCTSLLVLTGQGRTVASKDRGRADYVVPHLEAAAKVILS